MKQVRGLYLPENDTYFSHVLQKYGAFEPGRLDTALKYVTRYRLALDIGAHIGLRSRDLSPLFSVVYAFEPNPTTYCCLVENISLLGNITAFNVALGAEDGEVAMMESTTRPGNSGSMFVTQGIGTQMRTLDSYGFKQVDFLKIDCEGYEYFVLQGGKETIFASKPTILIEEKHFRDREGRIDIDYKAATRLLEEWGMRCVEVLKNDKVYTWS